jgi:hypothetical protein
MQLTNKRGLVLAGGVLSAALMLSVPVLAVAAVASWGLGGERTAIDPGDDAVRNGFRIVDVDDAGNGAGNSRAALEDQPSERTLLDWRYTRDKNGSPGH